MKPSKGEMTDPCEYEFELFMELKGQFTKVTLINAELVKTTYLSKSYYV